MHPTVFKKYIPNGSRSSPFIIFFICYNLERDRQKKMVGPITKWIPPSLFFMCLSLSKLQQMEKVINGEDLYPLLTFFYQAWTLFKIRCDLLADLHQS